MPRCNREITSAQVRVINDNGEMIGVLPIAQALRMAADRGMDLVEISSASTPPVCKVMNFSKYRYELQKKAQAAKKKQKVVETKEIKVRPAIADGDYKIKLRRVLEFLAEGNKVRISLQFKGREIMHEEVGFNIINRFKVDTEAHAKIEVAPKMEGKQIFMILVPNTYTVK